MSHHISDVNDDSHLSEIEEAKKLAGAQVTDIQQQERAVFTPIQEQISPKNEVQGGSQPDIPVAGRALTGKMTGNLTGKKPLSSFAGQNRFDVACDVAFEAAGVGALTQGAGMIKKLWSEGWNPAIAGAGQRTMEDLAMPSCDAAKQSKVKQKPADGHDFFDQGTKEQSGKSPATKGRIWTENGHANLVERGQLTQKFCQDPGKVGKAKGMTECSAQTFEKTKQIQNVMSKKLANEKILAHANKAEIDVKNKISHTEKTLGLGRSAATHLVNNLSNGPKRPTEKIFQEDSSAGSDGSLWS